VWRVHFATAEDASEELLLSEDYCQTAMRNFLPAGAPYQIVTRRVYTIQQRVAKTFRHGRALLAGDAAHANSPIGAMGMNSGVHDAINLAEKLTSVMRGGPDDVLDRYDRQRRTVAIDHVQAQTVRNKKLMNERDPAIRRRNLDELRRQAADPKRARDFLLRASMIASVREADAIP
jgi:3-(3-hydroxy-phenyl)propionate hydroxylase